MICGTHLVIKFDAVKPGTFYSLVQLRISTNGGDPERDVLVSHLSGRDLLDPSWTTPALPSMNRPKSDDPPKIEAPHTNDPLLRQEMTDFNQLLVEEPVMDGEA